MKYYQSGGCKSIHMTEDKEKTLCGREVEKSRGSIENSCDFPVLICKKCLSSYEKINKTKVISLRSR